MFIVSNYFVTYWTLLLNHVAMQDCSCGQVMWLPVAATKLSLNLEVYMTC